MPSIINASTSTGLVTTADTSGVLQLQTGGTTALTVDASQNVGIGTASPTGKLDVYATSGKYINLGGKSSASASADLTITRTSSSTSIAQAPNIYFDDGTIANTTVIQSGAGNLQFWSFAGSTWTERMRILAGAPILSLAGGSTTATGTGIAFPATQSASSDANTLDDYEEVSTYTPTWNGGGVISVTQSTVIKIGKLVTWTYDMTLPIATGATQANIVLPYAMSLSWGNGCLNYTTSGTLRYISATSSGLNFRDTTFGVMTITALSGIRIIGNAIYEATS